LFIFVVVFGINNLTWLHTMTHSTVEV